MAATMLNEPQLDILHNPPLHNHAVHELSRLQADLAVAVRMSVIDEVGAAVVHQLNEPLTALLIYLHEIERAGESCSESDATPVPVWKIVGMAVREAERVCGILERIGHGAWAQADTQSAIARGRHAIDSWARNSTSWAPSSRRIRGDARKPPSTSPPGPHPLTPREREVLDQIVAGASNKQGSRELSISPRTFEVHRAHIMQKLGAKNAADLVRMALSDIK
jgi:DNA-binding CsgD family transcriptional regulator